MSARRPVLALTAVALVVRVATLDLQSFWSDEAATVGVLRHSFGGMLDAVWDGESTPPLFYVLMWAWSKLAGTGEIALRLPAAVLGAAAVPVVAALAARVAGCRRAPSGTGSRVEPSGTPGEPGGGSRMPDRAAVAAALLMALSPLTVWYSQEARAYALLILLAAGSTLALLRALEAPTRGRLAAWAALAIAAFWTHHFAVFLVAGQAGWALWALRARALPACCAIAAGGAALAPLLLHQRAAGRASFIADVPLHTRLAQLPKQVLVGYDGPADLPLGVLGAAAALTALVGLGLALTRARATEPEPGPGSRSGGGSASSRDAGPGTATPAGPDGGGTVAVPGPPADVVVLGVVAAGLVLPGLAAAVGQDFLLTRNLLGALPLVLALIAAGAAALPGRAGGAGAAAVAVLAAVGAVSAIAVADDPAYQRDDFRGAFHAALEGDIGPRLVVTDGESRIPASLYLGPGARVVPPGRVEDVLEIDVVVVAANEPGQKRATPALPVAAGVPPGFAPAGVVRGATWIVRRYVALPRPLGGVAQPTTVDPAAALALLPRGMPLALHVPVVPARSR
ncbi:hypothetical protein DSM112329_04991 [Paraconexibacter sp. AEG42_29]|uniref:Glycosyltransferase RgtA/B/C/D-like domain-containing protein n=1 Tax=Paraconexibacter sp. AEG42_29 TaxID=2997339 RepID=A0AAU7B261_9ACTN